MDTSGNAQSSGQAFGHNLRSNKTHAPPATPNSRGRTGKTPGRRTKAGAPVPSAGHIEDGDEEETPRAPRNSLRPIPHLLAQSSQPRIEAVVNREISDGSDSYGSKKSRSQSPTKSLMDFKDSNMPVVARDWHSTTKPKELDEFVDDMERIGKEIGCIPSAVKARFGGIGKKLYAHNIAEDGGVEAASRTTNEVTGGLGHEIFWYEVSKINRASTKCQTRAAPESTWNSEVHSRVLWLALQGHWEGKEVWYQDISSARISSKSLVPWNLAAGSMQSKMVDYAIVIEPNEDYEGEASKSLHNHIIEKMRGENGASINQTAASYIRYRPIGVSIETKKGLVGEDEAHVQLATWMTAQYTRLRQLMTNHATGELPSFPVLSVHGQRWFLMIAHLCDNGKMELIKELEVGDTGSFIGVYQVVAAIRRVAQWVNDDYRPWLESEILGKVNGFPASP